MATINGTSGNDVRVGGAAADLIRGFAGNDRLFGRGGNDRIFGGTGNDDLFGESGNDLLVGGSEDDTLDGGSGNDRLFGESGNDRLFGGIGNDQLSGGDQNDRLDGGSGIDVLSGGNGSDVGLGGFGSLSPFPTEDKILDFTRAQGDRIDLRQVDADDTVGGNQDFAFIGLLGPGTPGKGQLGFNFGPGGETVVMGNTDNDAAVEIEFRVTGPAAPGTVIGDYLGVFAGPIII
ncbi:MAG TPA: calcium-binding protein [Beijerinckiaceae bacterium]|jgi:Ca2+-binding RTX toxin-like protein